MFDLKAKLLAKGLVTKEQVDKVLREKSSPLPAHNQQDNFLVKERLKAVDNLKKQTKAEQYITIRKWVDINRLDKSSQVSLDSEKFFINTKDNQVTWLSLPKEVVEAITNGHAAVIAYMSNHGLTHAVVPRDIAEDIREVFPEWIKVLNDSPKSSNK